VHASWISYRDYPVATTLAKTIEYVRTLSPSTEFVVIGGVPQWPSGLPKLMYLNGLRADVETFVETPSFSDLVKMDQALNAFMDAHGVSFLSALDRLCPNSKCLAVTAWHGNPTLVTWDDSHLTEAGSVLLVTKLASGIPFRRSD
jgi:hypothetical protein